MDYLLETVFPVWATLKKKKKANNQVKYQCFSLANLCFLYRSVHHHNVFWRARKRLSPFLPHTEVPWECLTFIRSKYKSILMLGNTIAWLPWGSLIHMPFPAGRGYMAVFPGITVPMDSMWLPSGTEGQESVLNHSQGAASSHRMWFLCPECSPNPRAGPMERPYSQPTFISFPYGYYCFFPPRALSFFFFFLQNLFQV